MFKNRWVIPTIIMSLTGFGATSTAMAQPEDSTDEGALLEEIIVTATRREQSIYSVPVAVSAFNEETIFKQGIVDLTDIGKFVPNMTVTGFSAGHVSSVNVFIRGIGLQDHLITTDPGVGVYIDGVYLGRQVGQNWSAQLHRWRHQYHYPQTRLRIGGTRYTHRGLAWRAEW
jgi:iron complex outermembrane receptor protein